ncbi:autotransporter outer membrane beta-barrel domain-containing protein, partial [Ochrobactrum sp. GPK 3]
MNAASGSYANVIIGNTGNGTLQSNDGGTVTLSISNKLTFGAQPNSSGTLTVSNGSNLSLQMSSLANQSILSGTTGTINVMSGGQLSIIGTGSFRENTADLTINVGGPGSRFNLQNRGGNGLFEMSGAALNVSNGAIANFAMATLRFNDIDIMVDDAKMTAGAIQVSRGSTFQFSGAATRVDLTSMADPEFGRTASTIVVKKGAKLFADTFVQNFALIHVSESGFLSGGILTVPIGGTALIDQAATASLQNNVNIGGRLIIDGQSSQLTASLLNFNANNASLTVSNGGVAKIGNGIGAAVVGDFSINIGSATGDVAVAPGSMELEFTPNTDFGDNKAVHLVFNHTDPAYQFSLPLAAVVSGKNTNLDVNVIAGRTIFTADNTYNRGTKIGPDGILQLGNGDRTGSIFGDVTNDGILAFNRTDQFDFMGKISGSGKIEQLGTGTLRLTADNSLFTGITYVNDGILLVDGVLGGTVKDVTSGGQIGGGGFIRGDLQVGASGGLLGRATEIFTIEGNLTLADNSVTNVILGLPGKPGLFNIGGNLVLDGTLNVSQLDAGFGPGIYRIFDYAGALTNQGLMIGTVVGADASRMGIQTNIDHQVNLVSYDGIPLTFWDGNDIGAHNNNQIDGGDEVWTHAPNSNWTHESGIVNAGWTNGAFAIFTGKGGTVTVDVSSGEIVAGGMQFAVDHYNITGDAITLGGENEPVIRVHDQISAVIESELRGAMGLRKTDYGTLILAGDNNYTGGTTVQEGTLQLGNGGTHGSVQGDILLARTEFDIGSLAFDHSDAFDFSGNITGEGTVFQRGSGTTTFSGNNTFAGGLVVERGAIRANSNNAFGGGRLTVGAGTVVDLNDINQALTSINNGGIIQFGQNAGTTLHVSGNYQAGNGALIMNAVLAGDDASSDRLIVGGDTSGTTVLKLINRGGTGALTRQGILLVEINGQSRGVFQLNGDFVTADGQPAVIGGAYAYTLHKGGKSTPDDGNWYLRSEANEKPVEPVDPENPVDPVDPNPPVNPDNPHDPDYPVDPNDPVDPNNPVNPHRAIDPDNPVNPEYQPGVPVYQGAFEAINNLNKGGFSSFGSRMRSHGTGLNGGQNGNVNGGNDNSSDSDGSGEDVDGVFRTR